MRPFSFEATKSTKGASKARRDLINSEVANLRDLLPLPSSTRQRLSQLQLMALVCVFVRKSNYFINYFKQIFHKFDGPRAEVPIPPFGFSKALSGFIMMLTQNGKLLYISDNAAEYLGHSMEDLLIHGDSVYDIIEKQDHTNIQSELSRNPTTGNAAKEIRTFLCRMNVSRNARRQMRFGDQKVVLVQGHFAGYLPLCSRNEPVFLALCTPVAMPETRECVVQGSTHVFTSIHSMDMKILHLDRNGEFHLGYQKSSLQGVSWYELVHWDHLSDVQSKHKLITQNEQERSCIVLLRLQSLNRGWIWIHCVLQVKDASDSNQQPIIVCTNQVLSEREAYVMRQNSWLYQYYSLHSKMSYNLGY
ncbi:neuronal PAS domain-containing protein 4-like, partial [Varroa jacobsoni]|uniref:neuronal PAS domain-containing protein 4-like n=1 Tax=Varroa jacobsoni TaxID=62625 RepID=UPI000BFA196B